MNPKILMISDNEVWLKLAHTLAKQFQAEADICIRCGVSTKEKHRHHAAAIDVRDEKTLQELKKTYDTIISMHCHQIFPEELVNSVLCLNLHPGIYATGRGWAPYVHAMYHGYRQGAMLHVMDAKIDHGPIIAEIEIERKVTDTCDVIYERILNAEWQLLNDNLPSIIDGTYSTKTFEGTELCREYRKKDYDTLCDLRNGKNYESDLDLIKKLSALSFKEEGNAYFFAEDGTKVKVGIFLQKDTDD